MFKKIKVLIKDQLQQGTSPERLAQSMALGIWMGACPVIGISTVIAAGIAHVFKLNHVVVQTVNYAMYPVQIPLIPLYLKAVSWFTDVGFVPLRPDLLVEEFQASPQNFISKYSMVLVYAIIFWLIGGGILFPVMTRILVPVVVRLRFSKKM